MPVNQDAMVTDEEGRKKLWSEVIDRTLKGDDGAEPWWKGRF